MENKEWLNNLKIGDKVFVVSERYGTFSRALKTIEKITPTKQIVVNKIHFKNGIAPRTDKWCLNNVYLEQATEEKIEDFYNSIFARKVLEKFKNLKSISFRQAQDIMNVMGWKEI